MEKSSSAFRTISEVAEELTVPKHVLRFWEGKFSQLRPMKRGGGRRYYRPEDVDLLRGIRCLLYRDGYTIKGVQKILRGSGVRFVKECWRDGGGTAQGSNMAINIPDLAKEAASEARQGLQEAVRSARKRAPAAKPPAAEAVEAAVETPKLTEPQRRVLSKVLRDLEECRELLRASTQHAPAA